MLFGLLFVFLLDINKVIVDDGLGEVTMWAVLLKKLVDVGFVHRSCSRGFEFQFSVPVLHFLILVLVFVFCLCLGCVVGLCRAILGLLFDHSISLFAVGQGLFAVDQVLFEVPFH